MQIKPKHFFALLLALLLLLAVLVPIISMTVKADEPDGSSAEEENPLTGKTALFVGDSICEAMTEWGDPTYARTIGWAGRIFKSSGMTGINASRSGASLSNCRDTNTVIAQLATYKSKTFDYVILHGGVNDAWDVAPVGEMTEGFAGPFDLSTFAGGLENTIRYAKEQFPDAIVGYIINFRLPASDIGSLSDMSAYFDEAKRICDKWGVSYLDLYSDIDFNYRVLKVESTEFLPDHIHPNSGGYNLLAPVIEAWMKTLTAQPEPVASEAESSEPAVETGSEPTETSDAAPADASQPDAGASPSHGIPLIAVAASILAAVLLLLLLSCIIVLLMRKRKKE